MKKYLASFVSHISSKLYMTLSYLHNRGKLPNFSNPTDLSEIIYSQILSGEINKFSKYVDKIEVRKYLTEWGYEEYLPKIYGIWKSFNDIDFDSFPNKFVLKTNHGCGGHYICKNKEELNLEEARMIINKALNTKFGNTTETQYNFISPLIFCEEYIDDPKYDLPLDYKFMCCDGEVRCVLVCSERSTGTKLSTYSLNWERLSLLRSNAESIKNIDRPDNFEKMIEIAASIAAKFLQVRVDMYNIDGRILLGELTFTPQGGIMNYYTNEALKFLGHRTAER